jgi:hypothetical protein
MWLGPDFVERDLGAAKYLADLCQVFALARLLEKPREEHADPVLPTGGGDFRFAVDQVHHVGGVNVDDQRSPGFLGRPDKADQAIDVLRRE